MKDFKWFLVTLALIMVGLLVWMFAETAYAERYTVYTVDASGGLNVRLGPDIEYKTNGPIADGAEVVAVATQRNWALVNWRSMIGKTEPMGWVCMDYLVKKYDIIVNLEGVE